MNSLKRYRPAEVQKNWTGRASSPGQYLYQKVEQANLQQEGLDIPDSFALLGYCCDAGVARNQGRPGAVMAPAVIRSALASRADHMAAPRRLVDVGDIYCEDDELELTQAEMSKAVEALLNAGATPIVLGGGHDLAFAHGRGVYEFLSAKQPDLRLGILNLDAHFDLRPLVAGKGNSGTPFSQLADLMGKDKFSYCCLGIQRLANPPELFARAEELGVTYAFAEDCLAGKDQQTLSMLVDWLQTVDRIYLTIDIDGFAAHYAPGVSAPSPFGFSPIFGQKVIQILRDSGKLLSCDLVELNPKYDIDGRTARLAAGLITELIYEQGIRSFD